MTMEKYQASKNASGDRPIKVYVRMRGLNQFELQEELVRHYSIYSIASKSWKMENDKSCVQTTNTGESLPRKNGKTHFTFDRVFDENTTTEEVYEHSCRDLVKDFVSGVSGSVILYGQTGTGKTYTMQGTGKLRDGQAGTEGIIHMAIRDLFKGLSKHMDCCFLLRMSAIEIYNEEVRDLLLSPGQRSKVTTRYDSNTGLNVETNERFFTSMDKVIEALTIVDENRVCKETEMNKRSSRSHVVFRLVLEKMTGHEGLKCQNLLKDEKSVQVSTLSLIDLAGSDPYKLNSSKGNDISKEGSNINKSLLALSHVIADLGRSRKGFINFRDSNLTKILQRDLLSNCNVSIVCCISPSGLCTEQTRKTLEFGKCAYGVKSRPKPKNRAHSSSTIIKTLSEVEKLKGFTYAPEYKMKEVQARLQDIEKSIFNFALDKKEVNITAIQNDSGNNNQSVNDDVSLNSRRQATRNHSLETSESDPISKAQQKLSEMEVQWSAMKSSVLLDTTFCNAVPLEIQFQDGASDMQTQSTKECKDREEKCHNGTETCGDEGIDNHNDIRCDDSQNFNDDCDVLLSYSMDSFSVSSEGTKESKTQENGSLCQTTTQSSSLTHISSSLPASTIDLQPSLDSSSVSATNNQEIPEPLMEHKPSHDGGKSLLEFNASSEDIGNHKDSEEEICEKNDSHGSDSLSLSSDGTIQSKKQNEDACSNQCMQSAAPPSTAPSTWTDVLQPGLDRSGVSATNDQEIPEPSIEHEPSHDGGKSLLEFNASSEDIGNHKDSEEEICEKNDSHGSDSLSLSSDGTIQSKKQNEDACSNQSMQSATTPSTAPSTWTDVLQPGLDRSRVSATNDQEIPEPSIEHEPSHDGGKSLLEFNASSEDIGNHKDSEEEICEKNDSHGSDSLSLSSDGTIQSKKQNEDACSNQSMQSATTPSTAPSTCINFLQPGLDRSRVSATNNQEIPEPSIEHEPSHDGGKGLLEFNASSEDIGNHKDSEEEICEKNDSHGSDSLSLSSDGTIQSKKQNEDACSNQCMQSAAPPSTAPSTCINFLQPSLDPSSGSATIDQEMSESFIQHEPFKEKSTYLMDKNKSLAHTNNKLHSFDLQDCNEEQSYVSDTIDEAVDYFPIQNTQTFITETIEAKEEEVAENNLTQTAHVKSKQLFVDRGHLGDVTSICTNQSKKLLMATCNFATYDLASYYSIINGILPLNHDAANSTFNTQCCFIDKLPMLIPKCDTTAVTAAMTFYSTGGNSHKTFEENDESSQAPSVDEEEDELTLSASSNSETFSEYFTNDESLGKIQKDTNSSAKHHAIADLREMAQSTKSSMLEVDEKLDGTVISGQNTMTSQNVESEDKQTNKEALKGNKQVIKTVSPPENFEDDDDKLNEASSYDELELDNECDVGGDKENVLHLSNSGTRNHESSAKIAISNGARYSLLTIKEQRGKSNDIVELSRSRLLDNASALPAKTFKQDSQSSDVQRPEMMKSHAVEDPIKVILEKGTHDAPQERSGKTTALQTDISQSDFQPGGISHNSSLDNELKEASSLITYQGDKCEHNDVALTKMEEPLCNKEKLPSFMNEDIDRNARKDKQSMFSPKKIASIEEGEAYLRTWELMLQSYRQHCDAPDKIFV